MAEGDGKMTNRLLIGAGTWEWAGWTSLDADETTLAHIIAIVPPLPETVKAQKWSEILASHFIEHLYLYEAKQLLLECYEVLTDGGILTLEQPNIEYCCKVIAGVIDPPPGRSREQFGWWGVWGNQNTGNPWYSHKWGYTPETLSDMVVEAGFPRENIVISPGKYHEPVRDFTLAVSK